MRLMKRDCLHCNRLCGATQQSGVARHVTMIARGPRGKLTTYSYETTNRQVRCILCVLYLVCLSCCKVCSYQNSLSATKSHGVIDVHICTSMCRNAHLCVFSHICDTIFRLVHAYRQRVRLRFLMSIGTAAPQDSGREAQYGDNNVTICCNIIIFM